MKTMTKTQFKVEVPIMKTNSSERTITKVSDYHLTHDKVKREIVPSQRNNYAVLGYYALNMTKVL